MADPADPKLADRADARGVGQRRGGLGDQGRVDRVHQPGRHYPGRVA